MRAGFAESHGAGRLGSLPATLGAGSTVQLLGALAGFVTVPILVRALGSQAFGVLVVVVSLAPWLTVVDGALYPATRLLVGESRNGGDALKASPALLRSALRLALKIASTNLATLVVSVLVLPLVMLFGSQGIADRDELVLAILAFSLPIVASGPGGIYLGALEGVGRTVVAAIFAGLGPLVALPLTLVAVFLDADLVVLCAIQGCSVALPRACAWIYWHLRPSLDDAADDRGSGRLRGGLVVQMVALSAAVLIQTGLDPVIVSSQLGAEQAGVFGVANRIVTGSLIPLVVLTPLFGANLAAARASGWSVDRNHELRRLVLQAGLAGLAVGVVVTFLGPVVARLIGAGQVAFPLDLYVAGGVFVFATFLSTPLYLAFSGPRGLRRSVRLNVALVTGNVAVSLVLVRAIGPSGPLWASALAGLCAATFWLATWRRHPDWLGEVHAANGVTGPGPAGPLP
jgi:O-antigen/teichoic acid export membrane protein